MSYHRYLYIWTHVMRTHICLCPCECSHLEPLCIHTYAHKYTYAHKFNYILYVSCFPVYIYIFEVFWGGGYPQLPANLMKYRLSFLRALSNLLASQFWPISHPYSCKLEIAVDHMFSTLERPSSQIVKTTSRWKSVPSWLPFSVKLQFASHEFLNLEFSNICSHI